MPIAPPTPMVALMRATAVPREKATLAHVQSSPMTYMPSMNPWASAVSAEPAQKAASHGRLWPRGALARNSNATPRRMRPISITATGR